MELDITFQDYYYEYLCIDERELELGKRVLSELSLSLILTKNI